MKIKEYSNKITKVTDKTIVDTPPLRMFSPIAVRGKYIKENKLGSKLTYNPLG